MHFPIIRLEKADTPEEDWTIDLPYEDSTLARYTDYAGELYTPDERKNVIKSIWLKDLFLGYADIDTKKETVTFYSKEKCADSFAKYLREKTEELYHLADIHKLSGFKLRWAGVEYKDCSALFYIEDYVRTSFDFMDDARYFAGETFKIGHIFDAHF